jgi:hypothetical protein
MASPEMKLRETRMAWQAETLNPKVRETLMAKPLEMR